MIEPWKDLADTLSGSVEHWKKRALEAEAKNQAIYDLAVQETRQEVRSALADLIFDWQEIADTRRCGTLLLSEREGQIYSACADRLRDMVDELAASLQAGVPQIKTEEK